MNFKKLLLSLVLTCSILSLKAEEQEQQAESKAPFVFKYFQNEEECNDFVINYNPCCFHRVIGLAYISNFDKKQAAEWDINNQPENFREKCNEAFQFLSQKKPISKNKLAKWEPLSYALNTEKIVEPEKYKNSYLLNPNATILFLKMGVDHLNTFDVPQEIKGLNFEQVLDKIHATFECYKKENKFTQDCRDIREVQTAIKVLKEKKS